MDLATKYTIIGVVIALILGIPSLYFGYKALQRKSLAYQDTVTSLFQVGEEAEGRIQVLFDDQPVELVHAVVVKVMNTGNVAIKKDDYETPLYFGFGDGATVISSEIVGRRPHNLPVEIISPAPSSVEIQPLLLNSRDTFTLKCLVADYEGALDVGGRIVDIRKIEKQDSVNISGIRDTLAVLALLGINGSAIFVLLLLLTVITSFPKNGSLALVPVQIILSVVTALLMLDTSIMGFIFSVKLRFSVFLGR